MRYIRVATPKNRYLLVLAESFFDETNSHRSDDRFCLAGYVFMKDAAEEQVERWRSMLQKWGLPYFHMVDCAHNIGVFDRLTKEECDLTAREAIQIIKDTASTGVYVTVLESDYLEIIPQHKFFGSAYDACARNVIAGVSSWIDMSNFKGSMHYYFEAGTDTENNASYCISEMMTDPDMKREACYAGHSFVTKDCSPGAQAADILAWHAGQDCKRALRGDPIRKDFASLTEIPHGGIHLTREKLHEQALIINSMLKESGLTDQLVDELEKLARRTPKQGRKKS